MILSQTIRTHRVWFCMCIVIFGCAVTDGFAASKPIRVLLLSGQNNHRWQETTPALVDMYRSSGLFEVDVLDNPRAGAWPKLDDYDVVMSNWTNWPSEERVWGEREGQALLDFVRSGKGFVIFHAASACFSEWAEYQQLIGATWGKGTTGHGKVHAFSVRPTDVPHPITRGLSGFVTTDELWHKMSKQPGIQVLAEAYSDKEKGGTGEYEPVVYVTRFGAGRSFHCVLGHDVAALNSMGCRLLMLRGTQWAATGKATVEIPVSLEQALDGIKGYERGQSRDVLKQVNELVQFARGYTVLRAQLIQHMQGFLGSHATVDSKKVILDKLALMATDEQASALALTLGDPDLGMATLYALEQIPGKRVLQVLRQSLPRLQGQQLVGAISTLGVRQDRDAVPTLRSYLDHTDVSVVQAVLSALGQIGGTEATGLLQAYQARASAGLQPVLGQALLQCADLCKAAGQPAQAVTIYQGLYQQPAMSIPIRRAAFIGLVREQTSDRLIGDTLLSSDAALVDAALHCLRMRDQAVARSRVAPRLGELSPDIQVQVIGVLSHVGDRSLAPAVVSLLTSEQEEVRIAVIRAMASLGDGAHLSGLMSRVEDAGDREREAISMTLARMGGQGVDQSMIALLKRTSRPSIRRELVGALKTRECVEAVPLFLTLVRDPDIETRRAAIQAVGALGDPEACRALIGAARQSRSSAQTRDLEDAVARLAQGEKQSGRVTEWVIAAMQGADVNTRISFLRILGRLGHDTGLQAVRAALSHEAQAVRVAAVRTLSQWPNQSVLSDLLTIVREPETLTVKVLALRGIARLYGPDSDASSGGVKDILAVTLSLAGRPDDKKVLLAAAARVATASNLSLVLSELNNAKLTQEAALAALTLAEALMASHPDQVELAIQRLRVLTLSAPVVKRLAALERRLHAPHNLAGQGVASSPDGLDKDGAAGGDQAAIDGDPATYWDEVNNKKLYRYQVRFPKPTTLSSLSIMGYQHHSFSPRDFDILCDGKVVKSLRGARYEDNLLWIPVPATTCQAVELRITGAYGPSPAIRELGIYHQSSQKAN
jgi:type 1 glutamine amidotransferase/HEAT repeat protein